jgi:AcrR family transcriptional regulator
MKKSKGARQSKKREQIIRTSESLFSRFGVRRVTVEEICREANVSKMTFYKYFSNKIALVRTIRDNWIEEGFAKFDDIDAMDLPFTEKINLMTWWKVEFFSRITAEFIRELTATDEVVEHAKNRYLNNITNAQKKGEIRSDIKPELIWMVTEKLFELTKEGKWKSVFSDYSQYQEQVRNLIFFGLLTRSGEKK